MEGVRTEATDDELARAIAASLKTAEAEKNMREGLKKNEIFWDTPIPKGEGRHKGMKKEEEKGKEEKRIRVFEEAFENQRFYPLSKWSNTLLPTDRYAWSSRDGKKERKLSEVKLPKYWRWDNNWKLIIDPKSTDKHGWEYAVDFQFKYHSKPTTADFVRRRRYERMRSCIHLPGKSSLPVANRAVSLSESKREESKDLADEMKQLKPEEQKAIAEEIKRDMLALGANSEEFECPVCLCDTPPLAGLKLVCGHYMCLECLAQFLRAHINQSKVLKCPLYAACGKIISASDARLVLSAGEWRKYVALEQLQIRNEQKGVFNCPTPDCRNSIFINDVKTNKQGGRDFEWRCMECKHTWCARCKTKAHPSLTCVENKQKSNSSQDNKMRDLARRGVVHQCLCGIYIQRNEGCKYMTCTQCGTHFCWDCKRFLRQDHQEHICTIPLVSAWFAEDDEDEEVDNEGNKVLKNRLWIEKGKFRKFARAAAKMEGPIMMGLGAMQMGLCRYYRVQRGLMGLAYFADAVGGLHGVARGLNGVAQAIQLPHIVTATNNILGMLRFF